MNIHNIASYKFVSLVDLVDLRATFYQKCESLQLKGTILVSPEGINVSLAGMTDSIAEFKAWLLEDVRFADMTFRESFSEEVPFRRLKVKLKKEIITIRQSDIQPVSHRAMSISPVEFKQWLDEGREITVLDTRNEYEMEFGTFENAVNLKMKSFTDFPECSQQVSKDKPIVMFCTGGVRCEKAALVMQDQGYQDVYQLDGGILNYFKEVGGAHYQGECFVFDGRVALNAELKSTGAQQCKACQSPIKPVEHHICHN